MLYVTSNTILYQFEAAKRPQRLRSSLKLQAGRCKSFTALLAWACKSFRRPASTISGIKWLLKRANDQMKCCNFSIFLQEFLSGKELKNFKSMKSWIKQECPSLINLTAIKMANVSSSWDINQQPFDTNENSIAIRSITESFQQGNISAIIGPVGSGKVQISFI